MNTKKHKISVKKGQVWAVGKMIIIFVKEQYNIEIGNTVKIVNAFVGDSLVTVFDKKTGATFDLKSIQLGTFLY